MTKFIRVAEPMTGEQEVRAAAEVIRSGRFVSGPITAEFEQAFAGYIGVTGAAAVNSGTAALHLALIAAGVGPGDEVIVPPLTFMSTVTAVLHQGAVPVFADIDPDSWCIDPNDVDRRITERTRAVIPVHLFGNAADVEMIMFLVEDRDIAVIEDCAQAHGTTLDGERVGSIGHMGAFSFYATKHMTTGEGGMVTSNNPGLLERIRRDRSHGMTGRDLHQTLGYNYRMTELEAALGLVQLARLEEMNRKRIANSLYILRRLEDEKALWFKVPNLDDHRIGHTFFWCPLQVRTALGYNAQEVAARFRTRGIEVRRRYNAPLYRQPVLTNLKSTLAKGPFTREFLDRIPDYASLNLPNVERVAGSVVGLPNHPKLEQSDLDRIVDTVLSLY